MSDVGYRELLKEAALLQQDLRDKKEPKDIVLRSAKILKLATTESMRPVTGNRNRSTYVSTNQLTN